MAQSRLAAQCECRGGCGEGGEGGGRTDEELDVGRVDALKLDTVAQQGSTAAAGDQAGVRAALDEAEDAAEGDEAAGDELWQRGSACVVSGVY